MVIEYILVAIIIAAVCVVYKASSKVDNKSSISFMETFNLTEMPIVTFLAGDSKINFLLDTGASKSFISPSASNLVVGEEAIGSMNVISATGTENMTCKMIETVLSYKDRDYEVSLFVNKGLETSFKDIKAEKGVVLHGVLGADFLDKYSYVLDFEKYLAYPKK